MPIDALQIAPYGLHLIQIIAMEFRTLIQNIKKLPKYLAKIIPYLLFIGFFILCWRWFDFSIKNNFDLAKPIVEGVIGGIVTSILILIFSVIWSSNITPWIENMLYKDTKIEGVWDGVLIPFIGINEIDKRRLKVAMAIIERRRKRRVDEAEENFSNSTQISAARLEEDGEKEVDAELILKETDNGSAEDKGELIDRKILLKISSGVQPIEVRAEISRTGHSIKCQLVEIGGASQIHTYSVRGSFKNLILTGEYENDDSFNIDRGSLSLMLLENGNKFEGFFHHMSMTIIVWPHSNAYFLVTKSNFFLVPTRRLGMPTDRAAVS